MIAINIQIYWYKLWVEAVHHSFALYSGYPSSIQYGALVWWNKTTNR